MKKELCSVILVAAGNSRRMGFDKLMAPLLGKPVLRWSLEALAACSGVAEIVLVAPRERFLAVTEGWGALSVPVKQVEGGVERHFSVAAGLAALSPEYPWVAIHDGARPLLNTGSFERCFQAVFEHKAAALVHPIVDTVKRADEEGYSGESVSRERLYAMETPQIFEKSLIEEAYRLILDKGELVTDEVSALEQAGQKTFLVAHESPNFKITYPEDLLLAERLLG